MRFSILLVCLLTSFSISSYSQERKTPPLDLIELLGELDQEDEADLEAAMAAIETQNTSKKTQKSPQSKPASDIGANQ